MTLSVLKGPRCKAFQEQCFDICYLWHICRAELVHTVMHQLARFHLIRVSCGGRGAIAETLSVIVVMCLVRLPPSIIQSPKKHIIYQQDTEVQLDCVAEGTPEPRYCTVLLDIL